MARLKNEYEFIAGMHYNGQLIFNRYRLLIDFYTNGDSVEDHNIAVERAAYFIYELLGKGVFVHEEDEKTIKKYRKAEIPVFAVPAPGPFDPVVLAVISQKLNAIWEDTLVLTDAELTSQTGGFITYVWDSADDEDEIHEIVNDDDDCKWWVAPTPRFISYDEGVDAEAMEEEHPFPIQWEMLDLQWSDEDSESPLEVSFVLDPKVKLDNDNDDGTVIKYDFSKNPKKKK